MAMTFYDALHVELFERHNVDPIKVTNVHKNTFHATQSSFACPFTQALDHDRPLKCTDWSTDNQLITMLSFSYKRRAAKAPTPAMKAPALFMLAAPVKEAGPVVAGIDGLLLV